MPTMTLAKLLPQGFLSDVLTAAGLVAHGKQCKALGDRLGAAYLRIVQEPGQQTHLPPPPQCFLARDVAELLGVEVLDVCAALVALGYPPRSVNMAVEPEEALAVAKRLRSA